MSKFICVLCKKESGVVQFGEFRCSECRKMHCEDHSSISVFSMDDKGNLRNDFSVCTECADRDTRPTKFVPPVKKESPSWWSQHNGVKRGSGRGVTPPPVNYKWKAPAPPDPRLTFFNSIPKSTAPLRIDIAPECYVEMMLMRTQDSDEIAGFGVLDSEYKLVWTGAAELDTHSGGHVASNSGEATIAALMGGHGVPNLQWHTHPGLSAYFSHTDKGDQAQFIMDAMTISKSGEYTFLCFDTLDWVVSKIKWEDGVATEIRNGSCYLNGVKMAKPTRVYTHSAAKPYTTVVPRTPLAQPLLTAGTLGPGPEEGLWQPYGNWMDKSFEFERVKRDTGEISSGGFSDVMSDYYKHFGLTVGDWESLMAAASTMYGDDWDWDLSRVANGGSL